MEEIIICDDAVSTTDVDDCANAGCGFNEQGQCTASGTECFGYLNPKQVTQK